MPASVKAVANEFLDLADDERKRVDPLQMQKLVYLAQGWSLGLTGGRLFSESIEAWQHGPVVPDLYHSLKTFGSLPIKGRLKAWDEARRRLSNASYDFDRTDGRIIRNIWEKYGSWSGPQLIQLTHEPGGPWDVTRKKFPGEIDARIDRSLMEKWFEKEAEKASQANDF